MMIFSGCVPEMHVGKLHLALNQVRRETGCSGSGVSSFSSRNSNTRSAAAAVCCSTLEILAIWCDGLGEAAHILDKRLNVAHRDGAVISERKPPRMQMRHIAQVADKVHQRHASGRRETGFSRPNCTAFR